MSRDQKSSILILSGTSQNGSGSTRPDPNSRGG
jgi:hypothetical protein